MLVCLGNGKNSLGNGHIDMTTGLMYNRAIVTPATTITPLITSMRRVHTIVSSIIFDFLSFDGVTDHRNIITCV